MNAKEYRSLPFYRIWRNKVLERDHYTCQDCGSIGGPLDVHHIVPFAEDVNGRFDPSNGIALCPLCHGRRHGYSNGFIRASQRDQTEYINPIKDPYKSMKSYEEITDGDYTSSEVFRTEAKRLLNTFNLIPNTGVYQRRSTPCK